MSDLKTPPQKDFSDYETLIGEQGGHFTKLKGWSTSQCNQTDGLDGVLELVRPLVPEISGFFGGKLGQCETGMHTVAGKVKETASDYAHTEHANQVNLQGVYGKPLSHFPDIGATPGMPRIGDFKDEPVDLKEPTSAEEDTANDIKLQLKLMRKKLTSGGELAAAEKIFKWLTGKSLIAILIDPIFGQYGRLKYLHDAYAQLSDGTYTVAATLRKGSWSLADEWTGEGATAFDSYMFRWSMGVGGIGDAAAVAAKAFKDGYDVIVPLVYAVLKELNDLINNELEELAKQGAEMAAGDAGIEAAGLGPEDPLADIGAGIFTAYKLYKIYKIVKKIITIIMYIEKAINAVHKAVATMKKDVEAVKAFFNAPMELPSLGSLVNDVEQNGFGFEKKGGWTPSLGAARVAMLPPAQ